MQNSKKIAYLIHTFPEYSCTFITHEIEAMRRRGFEIEIYSIKRPLKQAVLAEFVIYEKETKYLFPLNFFSLFWRHFSTACTKPINYAASLLMALRLGELNFKDRLKLIWYFAQSIYFYPMYKKSMASHLHVHFLSGSALIALFLNRLNNCQYSLTAHGTDIFVEKMLLESKIKHAVFTRVGTEFNKRYLDDLSNDKLQLEVIPFGIGQKHFSTSMRLKTNSIVLINVGRLVWQKGQHFLLQALALEEVWPNVKLNIYGEGPERSKLESLIFEKKLTDIVCLKGAVDEDVVIAAYRESDIFVMSSVSEGFGLVIVEAMAAGLPVIVPRLNGISEIVQEGVEGLFYETSNFKELRQKIELLVNDAELRRKLGAAARKRAILFRNEEMMDRFAIELDRCHAMSL